MLELIEKGGFMMYPILLSSILALGVTLERLYYFWIEYTPPGKDTTNQLIKLAEEGNQGGIEDLLHGLKTKVKDYYLSILHESRTGKREHSAEIAGDAILFILNRRLNTLSVIGSVTPLMGLLGTVLGMIRVFSRIAHAGSVADMSVLAGGIWEALITTAAGMIVAIPVIIIHQYFNRRLKDIAYQLKQNGDHLISVLGKQEST